MMVQNAWKFLLYEKNESMLLFPFWRDWEGIYHALSPLYSGDESVLRQMILNNLKQPLALLAKRVLVHEFRLLQKDNVHLTLPDFLNSLAEQSEWQQFVARYPVLKESADRLFKYHHYYLIELVTRLKADLKELEELFHLEHYEWRLIQCSGDAHVLGKQVAIISFHCPNQTPRQLIYKPRAIHLEHAFTALLDFINKNGLSKPLRTIKTLSKKGYGWVEYVQQNQIQKTDADEYYFKLGLLLGMCHLLNGRDIHRENIIASGGDPVIIDLECLFTPPLTQEQYDDPDFSSVFATLLIPPIPESGKKKYDFSGTMSQAEQLPMGYQHVVKGDFHRIVYLEKTAVFIEARIDICAYSQAVVEGYKYYMHWVINNREGVLEFIIKHFSHLETRIVFRPTFIYQHVLLFPNFALDKNHVHSKAIEPHELFDLTHGDIPYFSTSTTDTFVKNSQDELIELQSKCSGMECVVNKINCLDEEYIKLRVEQIFASLDG